MKDYNEIIRTYTVYGKKINVYACWSDVRDYTGGAPADFYDIYEDDGTMQYCLNEGDPYYYIPTKKELVDLVKSFKL